MDRVRKDLKELLEMELTDERLVNRFNFYPFEKGIQRAAKMRHAMWEYNVKGEPLSRMLLPDVNNLQLWIGRIYSLRIARQILENDFQ